jgi:porphobilinogen synthase
MTERSIRPRRLRSSAAMRRLVAETRLHPADLVLPMFVREGIGQPEAIGSMPGVVHHSIDSLQRAVEAAAEAGIGGVMLFGVPLEKDAVGSGATDPDGILNAGIRAASTRPATLSSCSPTSASTNSPTTGTAAS